MSCSWRATVPRVFRPHKFRAQSRQVSGLIFPSCRLDPFRDPPVSGSVLRVRVSVFRSAPADALVAEAVPAPVGPANRAVRVTQIARPGDQVTVLSYPRTSNSILRKTNAAATKICNQCLGSRGISILNDQLTCLF